MSRREHTCRKGVGEGPGWILGRGYQEGVVLGAEGVGGSCGGGVEDVELEMGVQEGGGGGAEAVSADMSCII